MLKNIKKSEVFLLLGILLVYLFLRIINLTSFPIFTDEAIYLRWAQIAKNDANWRFIALTDGKQPLYIWITMIVMKIIQDPLLAGRLVSVVSGGFTIIALFFLGKILFKETKIGILAAVLYLFSPFSMVVDRMAMMDSLLATTMLWALIFEILLVKTLRLDIALILGGIIGLAVLTKTSGFIALYLLPLSLLLFDWQEKTKFKKLGKWIILVIVTVLISQAMYSILRLSPFFHMIGQKDHTFVYGFNEWIKHPFLFFIGNLKGLFDWTIKYLTLPIVALIILGLFWSKTFLKEKLLIFSWYIIPLTGLALFGLVLYPRFIFFMVVPLFLLASLGIYNIFSKIKFTFIKVIIFILIIIIPSKICLDLIIKPENAKIPGADSNQYFNDWPSGWGVKESVDFFKKQAESEKISIFTEGTFGLMPASLELYLVDNKNIFIKGIWPIPEVPPKEVMDKVKSGPTFMVYFQQEPRDGWNLKKIVEYKKGNSNRYYTVYQVK